jgi:hypothetical protein
VPSPPGPDLEETRVDALFASVAMNQVGVMRADLVRKSFSAFLEQLTSYVASGAPGPNSGEVAAEWQLARRRLQEACFYSVRAISRQPQNQLELDL